MNYPSDFRVYAEPTLKCILIKPHVHKSTKLFLWATTPFFFSLHTVLCFSFCVPITRMFFIVTPFITQNILTAAPKYPCMMHFKSVKMKAKCRKQKEVVIKSHLQKICMCLQLLIKCSVNMQNGGISTIMYCKLTRNCVTACC